MKRHELLVEVKGAEAEARRLKEAAAKESEAIVREARRKSITIIDESKSRAEAAFRARLETEKREIDAVKERIAREGKAKADELRARGEANKARAVEIVVRNFEKGGARC